VLFFSEIGVDGAGADGFVVDTADGELDDDDKSLLAPA